MQELRSEDDDLTVGIVHWAVPPTIGGVESHLADYIRLLHDQGVKVVMFSGERTVDEELAEHAAFEYHPYLHLAGAAELPNDRAWRVWKLSRWLKRKIREHGIDVIHGHNLHHFSRVPAAAINRVCANRIARLHTYHNYWDNARCVDQVESWEGHWANSEYVVRQFRDGHPIDELKARYIGIDPDRFLCDRRPFDGRNIRTETPEDAPVILQPARLLPWKGPTHSVAMLHRLHEEGYRVRLVLTATQTLIDWDGERSALREELDELVDSLKLGEWVTFLDRAHYRDMPGHYNQADIVINPSHGEPLGLVALEAMAASRPVVVTNSGGMAETFISGTGALVVDDEDLVERLFEAVRAFLKHPEDAITSGREGREHVVKNFHMQEYVANMIDDYRASLLRVRQRATSSAAAQIAAASFVQPSTAAVEVRATVGRPRAGDADSKSEASLTRSR